MSETRLRGSAGAKFILVGEHSIVTRGRAVAFPLAGHRLEIQVLFSSPNKLEDETFKELSKYDSKVNQLIKDLCLKKQIPFDATKIGLSISSTIPEASGLGSSASLTVAATRAFFPEWDAEATRLTAIEGERNFHAKTSGLDPTVVSLEKPIIYRSVPDSKFVELDTKDFQKEGYFFALVPTGTQHDTSKVQQAVAKIKESTPLLFEDLMNSLSSNVEEVIKIFKDSRFENLPRILKDSHFRLLSLGLSTEGTDEVISALEKTDSFKAAKITGAGLGGYVLGLFRQQDPIEKAELKANLKSKFQKLGPLLFWE